MRSRRLAAAVALLLTLSACSAGAGSTAPPDPLRGTVTVFAAASLRAPFSTLAAEFEAAHPGATVALTFDGSASLVSQLTQGALADVFASADAATMDKLVAAGAAADTPVVFAGNTLTLVTPPDNPAGLRSFADAAAPGVRLVVCAPQVPCGAAAVADTTGAGLTLRPVSEELSVSGVLGKVISGEADAGLVYVSDALAAGDQVATVPLNLAAPTVNEYPITTVAGAAHPELARAFLALVTGPQGQAVLQTAGFRAP